MGSIDADAHVIESEATFAYMDPEYAHLTPIPITRKESENAELSFDGRPLNEYWVVDGKLQPRQFNLGVNTTQKESREMSDVSMRLAHMDELEIDIQVLYPTLYLRPFTVDPTVEWAMAKCYNRWIADVSKQAPDRLRWAMVPPLLSPHRLREEMEFCKENGACAVFLRAIEYDHRIGSEFFDLLYRLGEELDLPMCFHSGVNSQSVQDIYAKESGFVRAKLQCVGTFHSLVLERVAERYPKLRWGFVEISAQWIPYALNDLQIRFGRKGEVMSDNVMAENNIYVACQVTDDLDYVLKYSGTDNIVIGTDYGHSDTSTEIEALRKLSHDGLVTPEIAKKILDDNARALYGL
jgi:predicted TIM-barrel fold metal-dependent hydrolase